MKIKFSPKCKKSIAKIKKKDKLLFNKIEKQLLLFQSFPKHPSLRLHKLAGNQDETWSISVDMSHRLLFYYSHTGSETIAVFFTIGKHDEVYK